MSLAALKAFHEMVVSGEEKAEGPGVEETRSGIQSCQLYFNFVLLVSFKGICFVGSTF